MLEQEFDEILKMFDKLVVLMENPSISTQMNTTNVVNAFKCAHFIESTIAKANEIGKEDILENNLHDHWVKEGRSNLYRCSELANACDKLLEVYLKDNNISTDVVDEFIKLYVQDCGSERLNAFLGHILIKGVCTNIVIESLENLGVSALDMQDEALIMSWELLISNGNEFEVSDCIYKMFNNGFHSKLVHFAVNLHDDSTIKCLIIKVLSRKLVENDENVCLALAYVDAKSLWKLMKKDLELYANFLDSVFYFARHMEEVDNNWTSNCEFKYEHLVKIVKILQNAPAEISEVIYNRVQLVKTHPNGTIWRKVEKDIGW